MGFVGFEEAALVATTVFGVVLAASLLMRFSNSSSALNQRILRHTDSDIVFLFDGETLVDATRSGWRTFQQSPSGTNDLDRLQNLLLPRFPDLRSRMRSMDEHDRVLLDAGDNQAELEIENWDGLTRLLVRDNDADSGLQSIDIFTLRALEDEVQTLRGLAEDTPYLIWQTDPDGIISWANSAYLALHSEVAETDQAETWPPAQMFETIPLGPYPTGGVSKRVSVDSHDGTTRHWFDALSVSRGVGAVHFATSADSAVLAEVAQRNFVQTLTKTFAQLSTGLVIFDRDRHLAIFNPALLDLLKVPVEFLSQRPTLVTFLDRLREEQLVPEPKNYKSWRQQISDLETRAEDGTYCEVWTLPGGLTYRVTGRPHPNGAIAFLFEDISAEVSLTRRFRSEINLHRAVIDALPEAMAVFGKDGVISLTNNAYKELWDITDATGFVEITIIDAIAEWKSKTKPFEDWFRIHDFVKSFEDRSPWDMSVTLKSGQKLSCRVTPLNGGDTMVAFSKMQTATPKPKTAKEAELVTP